jgi:hypothetical protein
MSISWNVNIGHVRAHTIGSEQMSNRCSSSTVTSDDDMVWVASEFLDVSVDPLKSLDLVLEAVVQASARYWKEAVRAYSVVEGDYDDVEARRLDKTGSIKVGVAIGVEATAASVVSTEPLGIILNDLPLDEEKYWQIRGVAWSIHVKEQTVLGRASHCGVLVGAQANKTMLLFCQSHLIRLFWFG